MEPESAPVVYSPLAILNLFNNSISVGQAKRMIQLKGVFLPRGNTAYGGYYYDTLRDESADALLTIIVPALIRNGLQANKTIVVNGFITRRVVNNASRIDVQFTVTDLVEQTQSKYSDEDIQRIALLQAKADAGFRDVQYWIREKINRDEHFRIGVIIGKTAIIDQDIKHQLGESAGFYDLFFQPVSMNSEQELIAAMTALDEQGVDVIAVARGGGDNLEVFNKPALVEKAIGLSALLVTAIGHKADVTLLQQVADKAFITPTEFGQFLNDTFNHTVEEVQHSKARLVESVTKQLQAAHQKEVGALQEQLKGLQELKDKSHGDIERMYQEQIGLMTRTHQEQSAAYQTQLAAAEKRASINWAAVLISAVVGLILGLAIHFLLK